MKRLPVAVAASFVAGNVSSLLGIGGGIIKVPVLNAWCGVPLRAAAATSAFMIGVTATAGATIYYGRGQLEPTLAATAVLGVQLGSWGGMRFGAAASAKWLKILMAGLLFILVGGDVHAGRPMNPDRGNAAATPLERVIGVVLRAGVMASSACLAVGLLLALLTGDGGLAGILLHAGIIVLLATPVARVIVSIVPVCVRSATGRSRP